VSAVLDIALALQHLHSHNIVHRDGAYLHSCFLFMRI
jgi:hypothetical protein